MAASATPLTDTLSQLHLNDTSPEPITMLTLLKGPPEKKALEQNVRQWFCFGLNNSNDHHPSRQADKPRLVTNWKTETETRKQIANSLDSPPPSINQFSFPDPTESAEPLNLRSISNEVLLPFGEREKEILELLHEDRNVDLYHCLTQILGPRWPQFEAEVLTLSRSVMSDQDWIKAIRESIEPLDLTLWIRWRGMIGADSLDQEAEKSIQQDWLIQPVKVRRSSTRSSERCRRVGGPPDRRRRDSFISVFGDSDQESVISVASHSPITMMESIQEQEVFELDHDSPASEQQSPSNLKSGSPSCPPSSDSDSDEPDKNHAIAFKILERSISLNSDSLESDHQSCPSHGLKYSFGQVDQKGLGLQSSEVS